MTRLPHPKQSLAGGKCCWQEGHLETVTIDLTTTDLTEFLRTYIETSEIIKKVYISDCHMYHYNMKRGFMGQERWQQLRAHTEAGHGGTHL